MGTPKTEGQAIAELIEALAKLSEITADNIKLMAEAANAIRSMYCGKEPAETRLQKGEEGEP